MKVSDELIAVAVFGTTAVILVSAYAPFLSVLVTIACVILFMIVVELHGILRRLERL
jgi:hypothetical protein